MLVLSSCCVIAPDAERRTPEPAEMHVTATYAVSAASKCAARTHPSAMPSSFASATSKSASLVLPYVLPYAPPIGNVRVGHLAISPLYSPAAPATLVRLV